MHAICMYITTDGNIAHHQEISVKDNYLYKLIVSAILDSRSH